MAAGLDAAAILRYHDLVLRGDSPGDGDGTGARGRHGHHERAAWLAIADNHRCNRLLWDEEDQARRTDVPAATIAACKRRIDRYNQQRNDAVEALDGVLLAALTETGPPRPDARLSSESAGAMTDRLSILALKIHHMRLQCGRADAGPGHVATCRGKLARLLRQRRDLAFCLDRLLDECAAGLAYFKVYRQFKMYNDPALNPWLYRQQRNVARVPS